MELFRKTTLFVVVFLMVCGSGVVSGQNLGPVERLKNQILQAYNKFAHPEQDKVILVQLALSLIHIHKLDEWTDLLKSDVWIRMQWNDRRLSWNPVLQGNITQLSIPSEQLWKPDVHYYNGADASREKFIFESNMVVFYNGTVLWVPPCTITTICNLDLSSYPFDSQTCSIKFGSWTHDVSVIDVGLFGPPTQQLDLTHFFKNNMWNIQDTSAERHAKFYPCCPDNAYSHVEFKLKLRRSSYYYSLVLLLPSVVAVLTGLGMFWLPPHACERIVLGCISELLLVLVLVFLALKLPPTKSSSPMIAWFCAHSLILVAIGLFISILANSWSKSRHTTPAPQWMKGVLQSPPGKLIYRCLPQHATATTTNAPPSIELSESKPEAEETVEVKKASYDEIHYDWLMYLAALDKLCFFVSLAITLILLIFSFF